jgi:hydrogenase-4 component E
MSSFLIVIFAIVTIYLSVIERFKNYAVLCSLQGILLFGLAISELTMEKNLLSILNILFVILETLIVKAVIVPYMLFKTIHRNKLRKVHQSAMPAFYSLIFTIVGLVLCVILTYMLDLHHLNNLYFTVSLFTTYIGVLLIILHKKIFTHLIGFLVIENAVFLLSLSIGSSMPFLINAAILLDIFGTILLMGVFINKIGDNVHNFDVEELSTLKH